jgi:hypothetical protein
MSFELQVLVREIIPCTTRGPAACLVSDSTYPVLYSESNSLYESVQQSRLEGMCNKEFNKYALSRLEVKGFFYSHHMIFMKT